MALAPIEPITMNPIIRELMAINGARLVYRPKLLPQHLLKAPIWQYWAKIKKISQVKTPSGENIYDGIQIIARPNDPIKKAIKYIDNYANKIGISWIDLNFCCPGYKVLPKRRGGDLLKDPETIIQVISEVMKFTHLPISIKIRKGFLNSDTPTKLCTLIRREFGENIAWIAVNRAPVKMENVDFSLIKNDCKPFEQAIAAVEGKIPIIANGSIETYNDINIIKKNVNVNGFMIGRASLGNQAIFRNILDPLYSGIEADKINNAQIISEFEELFKIFSKYQNGPSGRFCSMGELKKILFYYIKHYFTSINKQLPPGYGFSKWNNQIFSPESLVKALFKIFPTISRKNWIKWINTIFIQ
ncbi:MAG: tRNA-dihydrouridine synthase family protein [Promethearchaeota archaeon]